MIYQKNNDVYKEEFGLYEANFFEEIDRWKTSNQNHAIQVFKSDSISDKEYEHVKSCIDIMKNTDDYNEYKKAFNRFCYFCHIVPRGVILKKYNLKSGKENKNTLYVEYSYNTKKIELPEGTMLYHMSKVGGIKELIPQFKGKSVKGFLYDKPRVYFTIRKNMPKFLADYKITEKMHMYLCKENIKYAYVDPLVWSNIQGAVYVETNKPIKVEEIDNSILAAFKKNKVQSESANIDFDNFYEFVTENGFTIAEE